MRTYERAAMICIEGITTGSPSPSQAMVIVSGVLRVKKVRYIADSVRGFRVFLKPNLSYESLCEQGAKYGTAFLPSALFDRQTLQQAHRATAPPCSDSTLSDSQHCGCVLLSTITTCSPQAPTALPLRPQASGCSPLECCMLYPILHLDIFQYVP